MYSNMIHICGHCSATIMKSILFLLLGVYCVAGEQRVNYDGYKVYRTNHKTIEQLELLSKLENGRNNLDFWSDINRKGMPVDIMVPPEDQRRFLELMRSNGIETEVFIDDVQKKIDKEGITKDDGTMSWTDYHTLESIHEWMDALAVMYPDNVTVLSAGSSYENRDIKGLKLSFRTGNRAVFIEGGIHAREWISPATVTYIINELLTSTDSNFRRIADNFDWYLFPSVNPDGFAFTHSTNRLWRKTRFPYESCFGADPNRNWNIHWGEEGTSTNPCSDTYGGPAAFSEIETKSLSDFISTIGSTLDVYLSFHSYSQLMLIPYGHTLEQLDNYDDVYAIGLKAVEAFEKQHGTKYEVGVFAEILYKASGNSIDWVKSNFGVPITYLIELRDEGQHGFVLPPEQIIPNCEEVMDALIAIFEEGSNLGYFPLDNE